MVLFIDSNIFLGFYHFSNDDLKELEHLVFRLKKGDFNLIVNSHLVDEFRRNRDNKIQDALKGFRETKLNNRFPHVVKEFDEYSQMKEAVKAFEKSKSEVLKKLNRQIKRETLSGDSIINGIFESVDVFEVDDELIQSARLRYDLGNPPGKNKSYGDAIHWECLLRVVEHNEDVYFISDDKDYTSVIDNDMFNSFLDKEWSKKKGGAVHFYKSLSSFLKDHFPELNLSDESEKEQLIFDLLHSDSFETTHSYINKLSAHNRFSPSQVRLIVEAAVLNSQLYWIASDEDIYNFMQRIFENHHDHIPEEYEMDFIDLYGIV